MLGGVLDALSAREADGLDCKCTAIHRRDGIDADVSDVLVLLEGEKRDLSRESAMSGALYDVELASGVLISPMIMLRSQWENRPFKTPFYINVMNEGVKI